MTEWNESLKNKLKIQGIEPKKEITDKADTLFLELAKKTDDFKRDIGKSILSVYGGSGVGKSSIATALSVLLEENNKKCVVLHGDHYPLRIPMYNDVERLAIFRENGLRELIQKGLYTGDVPDKLKELQKEDKDCDSNLKDRYMWITDYIHGGKKGLCDYLGTPKELDYAAINKVMDSFRQQDDSIWIRQMGRELWDISYQKVDVSKCDILILEWTHGYSPYLSKRDIQIFLKGSPKDTLENRIQRKRDENTASPFISIVLDIEQELIDRHGKNADIIMTKEGKIESEGVGE